MRIITVEVVCKPGQAECPVPAQVHVTHADCMTSAIRVCVSPRHHNSITCVHCTPSAPHCLSEICSFQLIGCRFLVEVGSHCVAVDASSGPPCKLYGSSTQEIDCCTFSSLEELTCAYPAIIGVRTVWVIQRRLPRKRKTEHAS